MALASSVLARGGSIYLAGSPVLVRQLLLWTAAFAWGTMYRLRGVRELGQIAAKLPPDEVQAVLAEDHAPLAVSRRMTGVIAEGRRRGLVSDYLLVALDQNVQLLVDYMGACERIHRTPVLTSPSFDAASGYRAFLKCENLQRAGSFKIRGALNVLLTLTDAERARGVVAFSSGNHAQGVALAARMVGTTGVMNGRLENEPYLASS